MTRFLICITTKNHIVLSTQTYCSKHKYKIYKHINANLNLTTAQWKNNPYIGDTYDKLPEKNYDQQLDFITYTDITIQTPL